MARYTAVLILPRRGNMDWARAQSNKDPASFVNLAHNLMGRLSKGILCVSDEYFQIYEQLVSAHSWSPVGTRAGVEDFMALMEMHSPVGKCEYNHAEDQLTKEVLDGYTDLQLAVQISAYVSKALEHFYQRSGHSSARGLIRILTHHGVANVRQASC